LPSLPFASLPSSYFLGKERGWRVNTQLMLLERYCKASEIDCESKIRIEKPFKGDPNTFLIKQASEVKSSPIQCVFTPTDC
jgi:hypothetical protein